MLSLNDYHVVATKCIKKFADPEGKRMMLADTEAIGYVVGRLIRGDMRFKEGKGKTEYSWRNQQAIFAIQDYLKVKRKQNKRRMQSLFDTNDDGIPLYQRLDCSSDIREAKNQETAVSRVDFLMKNSALTDFEKKCIRMKFFEDMTLRAIASQLECTPQNVLNCLNKGMNKMKLLGGNR